VEEERREVRLDERDASIQSDVEEVDDASIPSFRSAQKWKEGEKEERS
jgi:hypothetical protein